MLENLECRKKIWLRKIRNNIGRGVDGNGMPIRNICIQTMISQKTTKQPITTTEIKNIFETKNF